ncbi:MAG: response regulator [Maribacter sp.]
MFKTKFLIAVVDDDQDDRELFIDVVKEIENCLEILQFENGSTFLNYLKKSKSDLPNLVFLDLNMPMMGGMQCLVRLREFVNAKELPVVIYSTSSSTQYIDEAYSLGANLYIPKPNDFNALKRCVDSVLKMVLEEKMKIPTKETFLYTV